MKDKKNEPIDVFKEAAMEQLLNTADRIEQIIEDIIEEDSKVPEVKSLRTRNVDLSMRNDSVAKKAVWDELTEAMTGVHAQRFNDTLTALPDREFIRVYLKALEYFMPKVTRREGGYGRDKSPTINIQINRGTRIEESNSPFDKPEMREV